MEDINLKRPFITIQLWVFTIFYLFK